MLQSAIELNNTGVGLIRSGDYTRAIVPLLNALKIAKQCCSITIEDAQDDCCAQHRRTASLDMCIAHTQSECLLSPEDENEHYMHREAICIPPSFLLDSSSQQKHYVPAVLLTAVVLFNLALLHQLSAQDGENHQAKLTKAAQLYTLVNELHVPNRVANNVWFAMATVNNLGLVHAQLQDATNANRCFEGLLAMLMFSTEGAQKRRDDFDGFLRNVSRFISTSLSIGAPAA
jgi:hypothetical protein